LTYLLDTDICSFALKRRFGVVDRLAALGPEKFAVSVITVAEGWAGAAKSHDPLKVRRIWDRFLKPFRILPFDVKTAEPYAVLRAHLESVGRMIGGNDALIAATGLAYDLVVVTNNDGEFGRVPGLRVENWAGA
jgi:tRNA(fMet)-specific endonuclease VapC